MKAYASIFSTQDIDNLTAFIRSRASSWQQKIPKLKNVPSPDQYIINPKGKKPNFKFSEERYVSAKQLNTAIEAKNKLVLLDTRVPSVWQMAHIEGAIPVPYYVDLDEITKDFPKDVKIIAYCSCPRAAADHIVNQLRARGFSNTATLHEGIFGWMHQGFPVKRGDINEEKPLIS